MERELEREIKREGTCEGTGGGSKKGRDCKKAVQSMQHSNERELVNKVLMRKSPDIAFKYSMSHGQRDVPYWDAICHPAVQDSRTESRYS